MVDKNGKTRRAKNLKRDPLAREFAEPRDPIEVHNQRLARDKRAIERDRKWAKESEITDSDRLAAMRRTAERYRKLHPSTVHNVPRSFRNDHDIRMNYKGVEMRLGVPGDPEDEEGDE